MNPTSPHLFFSKNDPDDPRLGDYFKPAPTALDGLSENDIALIGYPDDEGIKLNGGRPGAAEAPQTIRQFLYKMTWPLRKTDPRKFWDLGDLEITEKLENRHEAALKTITSLQQKKIITISLGGGHDYGFSDTAGFVQNQLAEAKAGDEKPMVINFDAHLDVRPTDHGPNSGTPFYRLLSGYAEQIDFVEIGLQPQCNSVVHRDWALKKKAHLFDLKEVEGKPLTALFEKPVFRRVNKKTPVFISFDMDALTASEAGGCSQSWVTGLKTQDCLNFLTALYQRTDTRGLGIYETSPLLDSDFRTSKTAALIAYSFIFQGSL